MKKYIYSSIFALVATAGFTACSDDDVKYDGPGAWDANSDYANVYFKTTSATEQIDPADPTEFSFNVYRRVEHEYTWGKDAEGKDSIISDKILTPLPALTLKPTILENTDNAFIVSDAVFAEGDTVATITTTFPNAGIGNPNVLKVTFSGADAVSSYSQNTYFNYTVTRVKWNEFGTATFRDDFWFEDEWEVQVLQRDDDNSYFRVIDPFGVWADELDGNQTTILEMQVLKKGDNIGGVTLSQDGVIDWYRINTGYFHPNYEADIYAMHPQNFTSADLNTAAIYANNIVTQTNDEGQPTQFQLAPYWYMFGVGGWNYTTQPTIFITMPDYVAAYVPYEATIDEDFEFEDVFEGIWKSAQLGTSSTAKLQQGVCTTTTDGCDSVFAAKYGTVYKVVAPYAEGYDLLFAAKGKKITAAPDYEDPQPIGISALGEPVYAIVNTEGSEYTDDAITLNIRFVSLNSRGQVTVEYGSANEQLLNLSYTEVGTGVYTYGVDQLSQDAESFYEGFEEATLYQCDQMPGSYYLTPWAESADGLAFTVQSDNTIKFYQSTGESYGSYGEVFFIDIEEYNPNYTAYLGKFDGDKTFEFNGSYYIPGAGGFGLITETFVLGAEAPAAARTLRAQDLHLNKSYKAAERFVGKKVQPQTAKRTLGSRYGSPVAADIIR